ncbi:cytochrome c [Mucilaginibacter sp. Mucisp86]|uniref:c-type cytochrome n=1 Tax=Mucilaginibacter sp. Mucisp86 TaxID=3243060 RepID=UPI0039B672C3
MKKLLIISTILIVGGALLLSFRTEPVKVNNSPLLAKDSVGSTKAFMSVYKVLMSARCMNCHPSGDVPLQGDDSHLHTMNVKRGADGHGIYAVRCSNCHQAENTAGLHMPPGNPKWGLPPANMRMVFQGRTPRQLALQLLDPKQNGGRTKQQLIDHMAKDDLVGWAWHPGDGRTLPPMSRTAFVAQVRLWIAKGAYAPSAKAK